MSDTMPSTRPKALPPAPLRIMRIIARMNVGGPAWQVSVLTRGLENDEFTTMLVTGTVADGEADFIELRDPTLPVTRLASLGRSVTVLGDLQAFVQLVRLMRRERPDIVHTHTAKAGVLGRLAAIVARVPIRVHTFHGHVLHGYFSPAVTRLVRLVERVLARFTTTLVAVGEQVRDELLTAGIGRPAQYTVIAPGVDAPSTVDVSTARRDLGLDPQAPVVFFVGRITRIKRVDRLLEAWQQVNAAVPEAVLVIAGDGDLLDEARAQASHLGESVRFIGWQADLAPLYAAADVAVLTSDNEGMPVTLIEAQMAGTPAVTTDVGSAREVVRHDHTGLVVPANPNDVAAALVAVLTDDERRQRFGDNARVWAADRFGTDRLVADYRAVYHGLAHDRR